MGPKREDLLKDLKEHVIEVFFVTGAAPVRVTLRLELIPEDSRADETEFKQFHNININSVGSWNVTKNRWVFFDIKNVNYVQIVDGY